MTGEVGTEWLPLTNRRKQVSGVAFDGGGLAAVRSLLTAALLPLLSVFLPDPHQLHPLLPPADDDWERER